VGEEAPEFIREHPLNHLQSIDHSPNLIHYVNPCKDSINTSPPNNLKTSPTTSQSNTVIFN
jgi:hypothetical protein